ncbi:MAG: NAD(P)H-hydrate dehydratase [Oscillospiraceae bacterium]|nr:NAD(P)H-hydrate dehydratase [Oscillospiraceae bacterium]
MEEYLQVGEATLRQWLPRRKRESHKGDYGKVLLLCGAVGYTGAPVLAARAAARSGAGLVYVGVPETVYPIVAGNLIEPMVFPLPAENGMLASAAIPEILRRLQGCDACLVGCGLGNSAQTREVVSALLAQASCPLVLDADGINVLAGHIDVLRAAACPVIVTPHDGEFARLGGDLTQGTRAQAAQRLAKALGVTVLLKGYRTVICNDEACYVNHCGNPGMATGGSGDALAGILVSLLGQGVPPLQAAALAAWLHGTAGDRCAERLGECSLLPTDLIEELPRLLK